MRRMTLAGSLLIFLAGPTAAQEEVCQYGFVDLTPESGYNLESFQQLGIFCPTPGVITRVGFTLAWMGAAGTLDIVIWDDAAEVSRTNVEVSAAGQHEFDIPDVEIVGDACIMLCPLPGFRAGVSEDISAPGNFHWSNTCGHCSNIGSPPLIVYAVLGGATPTEETTWGDIKAIYHD